jgi:hypothetical protein
MIDCKLNEPILPTSEKCGNATCNSQEGEVCVATTSISDDEIVKDKNSPGKVTFHCQRNRNFSQACTMTCDQGESCRIQRQLQGNRGEGSFHAICLYSEKNLDTTDLEHSTPLGTKELPIPGLDTQDASLPWCILVAVFSLLPMIVILSTLVYRYFYKLPRQGKVKEELIEIFAANGFDENEPLYKEVQEFIDHIF